MKEGVKLFLEKTGSKAKTSAVTDEKVNFGDD